MGGHFDGSEIAVEKELKVYEYLVQLDRTAYFARGDYEIGGVLKDDLKDKLDFKQWDWITANDKDLRKEGALITLANSNFWKIFSVFVIIFFLIMSLVLLALVICILRSPTLNGSQKKKPGQKNRGNHRRNSVYEEV